MADPSYHERPCQGLDPDTEPCPHCGAWLSDRCAYDTDPAKDGGAGGEVD